MKHFATLICAFSFCVLSNAQILNGSFEQFSAIPSNMGQWQVVQGWQNAGSLVSSPDFYHNDGTTATDLPETPLAIVQPVQGNAIMGIIASGRSGTNLREYISTGFANPLHIGKKYVVSFKITNGQKTSTSLGGLGIDKLGMHFSVGPVVQIDQNPINVTPQVYIESVTYHSDWRTVNFVLIADQAYTHMTFGVFGDDNDKNITIMEGVDPQFAYYFVDCFSLESVDNHFDHTFGDKVDDPVNPKPYVNPEKGIDSPFFLPNTFTPNGDGNNETYQAVSNTLKEWEFEIYSKWGERVFFSTDETRGWDGTWNGNLCENGSYVWQITYILYDDRHEPKVIEERGIVNLVR